jgi:hypothetical protein
MGKLVRFRPTRPRRKGACEPVTLLVDEMLFAGVDLGNLIEALIAEIARPLDESNR